MYSTRISVVIPCFNEEANIQANVAKIASFLRDNFSSFEIIAVNDGSSDGTLDQLKKIQTEIPIRVINSPKNEGKGKAVKKGFAHCQKNCEIIMFLDADLAIPIEELPAFLEAIDSGTDLAIASRFVPGAKILKPVLWYRLIMERIFRLMRMAILNNWRIRDTQCGFKVFRYQAAKNIFPCLRTRRFAFDAEIIFLAGKLGYTIKELPVALQNPKQSHIRLLFDPLNMSLDLLRIRLNYFLGKYQKRNHAK